MNHGVLLIITPVADAVHLLHEIGGGRDQVLEGVGRLEILAGPLCLLGKLQGLVLGESSICHGGLDAGLVEDGEYAQIRVWVALCRDDVVHLVLDVIHGVAHVSHLGDLQLALVLGARVDRSASNSDGSHHSIPVSVVDEG